MSQNFLYNLFGLGKIPKSIRPYLEDEGIEFLEEGLAGSVRYKDFRAPGKRYSRKVSLFMGSLALTKARFWAFAFSKPVVSIEWNEEKLKELDCSLPEQNVLQVEFDISVFQENSSGQIRCRFKTDKARLFLERIENQRIQH